MSTLHQCHWDTHCQNPDYWQPFINLLSEQDTLLIYGPIKIDDQRYLQQITETNGNKLYWLNTASKNNQLLSEISYNQWLHLIIQHKNSYTWK